MRRRLTKNYHSRTIGYTIAASIISTTSITSRQQNTTGKIESKYSTRIRSGVLVGFGALYVTAAVMAVRLARSVIAKRALELAELEQDSYEEHRRVQSEKWRAEED